MTIPSPYPPGNADQLGVAVMDGVLAALRVLNGREAAWPRTTGSPIGPVALPATNNPTREPPPKRLDNKTGTPPSTVKGYAARRVIDTC